MADGRPIVQRHQGLDPAVARIGHCWHAGAGQAQHRAHATLILGPQRRHLHRRLRHPHPLVLFVPFGLDQAAQGFDARHGRCPPAPLPQGPQRADRRVAAHLHLVLRHGETQAPVGVRMRRLQNERRLMSGDVRHLQHVLRRQHRRIGNPRHWVAATRATAEDVVGNVANVALRHVSWRTRCQRTDLTGLSLGRRPCLHGLQRAPDIDRAGQHCVRLQTSPWVATGRGAALVIPHYCRCGLVGMRHHCLARRRVSRQTPALDHHTASRQKKPQTPGAWALRQVLCSALS